MGSYLDKLLIGIRKIYNNGALMPFETGLNFIGFTLADNPSLGAINITGGGGASLVTTTVNYNQPAVGASTSITVSSTANFFPGLNIAIQGGGYYSVTSVLTGTTATITNLGAPGNAVAGATINAGAIVDTSGPAGGFMPAPPATITGTGTTTSAQWNMFRSAASSYTITLGTIVAGIPYFFWNIPGGSSNISINPVTLARGANSFTIEDPQNVLAATASSVSMQIPGARFDFMLDATNNVFRCMGQVQ